MTNLDNTTRATLIKQLSSGKNRNDIILELCQQQSLDWKQGEAMVREVEHYDEDHIVRRQSLLLLVFSWLFLAPGPCWLALPSLPCGK